MPKCSKCGEAAPTLGGLRKHYTEKHPNASKKRRKKRVEAPPPDRERAFLEQMSSAFDAEVAGEELTQEAYDRVLAYLTARYGSPAEEVEAA